MIMQSGFRFSQLLRSQWFSKLAIEKIQSKKLQKLLAHAYLHVPYYRRLFNSVGIKPQDIRTPGDLIHLPITTKWSLLELGLDQLTADNIDPADCIDIRTSGSQGAPFVTRIRRRDKTWWGLLAVRGWLAHRYSFRFKTLIISDTRRQAHDKRWLEYLGLFRKYYTHLYLPIEDQLKTAMALRPDMIRGITSDIYLLAAALQDTNPGQLAPKLVVTSAELMDAVTRAYIAQAFGVDPVDFYGSIECGWIAWECPTRNGYHLNSECLIVECLRDGVPVTPGMPGELVVTNLHNYAMPFIRYSVGDVGTMQLNSCTCGRGLPLMQTVEGRAVDCITIPGGRLISPYQLTCTLEKIPGIKRYQILQQSQNVLLVKIIPQTGKPHDFDQPVRSALVNLLGSEIRVTIQVVDTLEKDSTGKFRVVMRRNGSGKGL